MTAFARNIVSDLVEKRLWPVAVALLVALVAVPVLLVSGSEPAPTTSPAPVVPSAPGASRAEVTLDTAPPAERVREGRLRDPFATPSTAAGGATSAATSATTTASTGSAGSGAATVPLTTGSTATATSGGSVVATTTASSTYSPTTSTPSASDSGSGTGSATAPSVSDSGSDTGSATDTTPTPAPTAPKSSVTYEAKLRFGPTQGERETLRDVPRLKVLPDTKNPVVAFLGVMEDGKSAAFLVSTKATATGNGACKPSAQDCKTVELREGDAEYFRVVTAGQSDVWYYLKLLHIDSDRATAAQAAAASVRHSRAGTAVVREAGASVRAYRYLPGAGVLVRAKHSSVGGAAAGDPAQSAPLLPADEQPGVVAWRSVKPAAKR